MATVSALTSFDNSSLPWTSGILIDAVADSFTIEVSPGPDYLVFSGGPFVYPGLGPSGDITSMVAQNAEDEVYYSITSVNWSASQVSQMFAFGLFAQLLAYMYSGNDQFLGSGQNDTILGYGGNDTITGGGGSDDMRGGLGDDRYFVNAGDIVTEHLNQGLDEVRSSVSFVLGTAEIEILTLLGSANLNGTGNGRANTLNGNSGNNKLAGLKGADVIWGGLGTDTLNGGTDTIRDSFVFKAINESGKAAAADMILGFVNGMDRIDLSTIDAIALTVENDAFAFSGTTAQAFSVWYKVTATGLRLYADTTGDLASDMEIRVGALTSIAATDFLL